MITIPIMRTPVRAISFWILVTSVIASASLTVRGQATPSQKEDIRVYLSVMDPKIVSDIFGKRVGRRYVAFQITIANKNEDFQYLIHDISIDLTKIWPPSAGESAGAEQSTATKDPAKEKGLALKPRINEKSRKRYEASSEDKTLVRGVAEKGQIFDTRNLIVRVLRGAGTIAGGLTGVATFGSSYAPSVAAFNGPVLSAITNAFPDMTVNQVNRLNDSAYSANTVVPKQASKVMVAFLPQRVLLDSELRKLFWKDPTSCFKIVDFRMAEAWVDGSFIKELRDLEFNLTSVQIEEADVQKLMTSNFEVRGTIFGDHFEGAKVTLAEPEGVSLMLEEGQPEEKQIKFSLKSANPVPPDRQLVFEITKNGITKRLAKPLSVLAGPPKLESLDKREGKQRASVAVKLTGTNFIPGTFVDVLIKPNSPVDGTVPIDALSPKVESPTTVLVTLKIGANAPMREYEIWVVTDGGASNKLKFKVIAAT